MLKVTDYEEFEVLGCTQDDAVGEAFDKAARVLGLPYPGGPEIQKLAEKGTASVAFPKAYRKEDTLNFSYSGLKTAVINYVHNAKDRGERINAADVAASFQAAATDMLVENAVKYGVGKKPGGGTVTISTRETEEAYLVMVMDTGVGFDPERHPEDGKLRAQKKNDRRGPKARAEGGISSAQALHRQRRHDRLRGVFFHKKRQGACGIGSRRKGHGKAGYGKFLNLCPTHGASDFFFACAYAIRAQARHFTLLFRLNMLKYQK